MKKIKVTFFIILLLGIIWAVDKKSCNKPGSISEKINWAGHNC
jgi:hypothetical protein